jgi:acyl-CoA thioesterase FadM
VHEKRIEIRWRDLDAYQHVNQAVYLTYLEETLDDWLRVVLASAKARSGTTWPRTSRSTTATSCGSRTGRRSAACGSSGSGRRA